MKEKQAKQNDSKRAAQDLHIRKPRSQAASQVAKPHSPGKGIGGRPEQARLRQVTERLPNAIVRTVDQVGREIDTNTYILNDHDGITRARFNPVDDRRRRRVFTTTAMVRNL